MRQLKIEIERKTDRIAEIGIKAANVVARQWSGMMEWLGRKEQYMGI